MRVCVCVCVCVGGGRVWACQRCELPITPEQYSDLYSVGVRACVRVRASVRACVCVCVCGGGGGVVWACQRSELPITPEQYSDLYSVSNTRHRPTQA